MSYGIEPYGIQTYGQPNGAAVPVPPVVTTTTPDDVEFVPVLASQQGDVLLFQINDDGEIELIDGLITMSGGLQTTAYLALFGGNVEDAGGFDESKTWWANFNETDPAFKYRSETQNLLRSLPAVPANLRRLEDAAVRDLSYLVTIGAATQVSAVATMPALNRVKLAIEIDGDSTLEFVINWEVRS